MSEQLPSNLVASALRQAVADFADNEPQGDCQVRMSVANMAADEIAAEARIIRLEEGRAHDSELRDALHRHRVYDVRAEARATHIESEP